MTQSSCDIDNLFCVQIHIKYQTKLHEGLVPRQLHDVGKVIQVRNEQVFVYDSKLKKKKLNTPVKGKEHSCSFLFSALKYIHVFKAEFLF